jgi:antitoxin MazE
MTQVVLGRWGKSIAVRFPNEIARELGLHEGERVEIDAAPDRIVIRRARPHYDLEELFAGKSADEWRTIYADAHDWGPDVGQENVAE